MVVGGASDQRAGCHPNRRPSLGERYSRILPGCGRPLSKGDEPQKSSAFLFPLLLKRRRGRGEEARFSSASPLSNSLPTRSSRGEREKCPQRFPFRTLLAGYALAGFLLRVFHYVTCAPCVST